MQRLQTKRISDYSLLIDSVTVLSIAGETEVVNMECCFDYSSDADWDGVSDMLERSGFGERALRRARINFEMGGVNGSIPIEGLIQSEGWPDRVGASNPLTPDFRCKRPHASAVSGLHISSVGS
jgi:hypothetical protein